MVEAKVLIAIKLLILVQVMYSESQYNYYLYTGENGGDTLIPMKLNGNVSGSEWNYGGNLKVLIHGWNSVKDSKAFEVFQRQKMLTLAREFWRFSPNFNIILVDWTILASTPVSRYKEAAANTRIASINIASFLVRLMEAGAFYDWSMVHLLGHSLGAHVSGIIGHEIQYYTWGDKIGRITGLDPAGPEFTRADGELPEDMANILDYTDAEFVDIIHTNMGPGTWNSVIVNARLGSNAQAGHIDFYPNGGEHQAFHCSFTSDRFGFCSHQMSVLFYALTLREPFENVACPCDSYQEFVDGLCTCDYPGMGELFGELVSSIKTRRVERKRFYLNISKTLSAEYFLDEI